MVVAAGGDYSYVKTARIQFERDVCFVVDPGKNIFEVIPKTVPVAVEVRPAPLTSLSVATAKSTVGAGDTGRLFEPREPETGGGSKVGLFVARGLDAAHGGTRVADVDDRLRFTLTLPPA